MKPLLRLAFSIVFLLIAAGGFAQAPNISYSMPQAYLVGKAISPLLPVNAGGAVPNPTPVSYTIGTQYLTGIAVDAAGNVFLADNGDGDILKIPAGGGPSYPIATGIGAPLGVAVDLSGNVYVADGESTFIREIPANGGPMISLGSGFGNPAGVAVDVAGNVFVADPTYHQVVKIPAGNLTPVVIGSGFQSPVGIAVDASDNLYITDSGTDLIKEIVAATNTTITYAYPAEAGNPFGIAVDKNGGVYYSMENNGTIFEIPSGDSTLVEIGTTTYGTRGLAVDGQLTVYAPGFETEVKFPYGGYSIDNSLPRGLNFDVTTGIISGTPLAVSAAANYKVTAFNAAGTSTTTINLRASVPAKPAISYASPQIYSTKSTKPNLLPSNSGGPVFPQNTVALTTISDPLGMTRDAAGNIYVIESLNYDLKVIPPNGGTPLSIRTNIDQATGVVVDAAGNIYLGDDIDKTVKEVPVGRDTIFTLISGLPSVNGIALDRSGNFYVSDWVNNDVIKIPPGGASQIVVATGFDDPSGMTTDAAGNVFVVDQQNNAVKKILAGNGNLVTVASGLNGPNNVAVDSLGNIYTCSYNNIVQRIPAGGGDIITIGTGFSQPGGISSDVLGNIYVSDTGHGAVTEIFAGQYFISPSLPAGLAFDNATGIISGKPTIVSPATNYTVIGYNTGGSSEAIINLTVTSASTNDSLSNITISKGTLNPAFNKAISSYTATVTNGTTSITLTPTTADPTATVTVNGTTVKSGSPSAAIALAVGTNTINTVVTAQDGITTTTYTVNVVRPSTNAKLSAIILSAGTLSPVFNANTVNYAASEATSVSTITLTPAIAVAGATVKVNGVAVTPGSPSGAIALKIGSNTITVVVTAQDGVTTDTYSITVTRPATPSTNCNLSALTVSKGALSSTFSSSTIKYTDMVTNGTTSVTLTPTTQVTTSTVTINGVAVLSGHASAAISLAVGSNAVTVAVTAQDDTTKRTYTINVIRPSTNAKLSAFTISNGTLTPVFNANTTSYTASVTNATSSVKITPTIAVTGATVKVNDTAVASGSASGAIALAVGSNTITTVVTAQDGVTTDTYTLTVTRAAAGENNPDAAISVAVQNFEPQLADDGINVHQGVSPNGDGINDYLQIDNITNYPDNNLKIMTRNGLLIYEAKGYDNATKIFDGHSNKNGQMQLPGTYFYELDYTANGIIKHKTGFLVLKY